MKSLTLGDLLGPTKVEKFLGVYWDRQALLVNRSAPHFYDALLNAGDIPDLFRMAVQVSSRGRSKPLIETIGGEKTAGRVHLRDRVETVDDLWKAFDSGSSILLQMAQNYWPALWWLCDDLERVLRSPVDATLIKTPARSQAFGRHYDRLDVLVVHLAGKKHWRLFDYSPSRPLQSLPPMPFESADSMSNGRLIRMTADTASSSKVSMEVTMNPGDFLYVPRGQYHEVWTTDAESDHLSIAVQPVTYLDLILAAAARRGQMDERLRARLPVSAAGFDIEAATAQASVLAADFARLIDSAGALADLNRAFTETHSDATRFRGGGRRASEGISLDTQVEHVTETRPEVMTQVTGSVELRYGDRSFHLPQGALPALKYITAHARFYVKDIPGLNAESQLILTRRLVRATVLRRSCKEAAT